MFKDKTVILNITKRLSIGGSQMAGIIAVVIGFIIGSLTL